MFSSIHRLLLLFCRILPLVQSGDKQKKKRDMFIHTERVTIHHAVVFDSLKAHLCANIIKE